MILITGAAQGQGAAIAKRFVAEGAAVVLSDVLDCQGISKELGDRAHHVHLDVADEEGWADAVAEATEVFGKLDGLVNNAGIIRRAPLVDTSKSDWDAVISVCQTAVFLGMKAVATPLTQAGGGTIVNTSSTSGFWGLSNIIAYTAAKFAVRGMTRVAAMELAQHGIRVNTVCPGVIDTPMARHIEVPDLATNASATWTSSQVTVPLGRKGSPEELANVVLFLTSDESSYCTGTEFLCDGGRLIGPIGA